MNQRRPRKHRARHWKPYQSTDFTRREARIDYQRRKRRSGAPETPETHEIRPKRDSQR